MRLLLFKIYGRTLQANNLKPLLFLLTLLSTLRRKKVNVPFGQRKRRDSFIRENHWSGEWIMKKKILAWGSLAFISAAAAAAKGIKLAKYHRVSRRNAHLMWETTCRRRLISKVLGAGGGEVQNTVHMPTAYGAARYKFRMFNWRGGGNHQI